jgi:hypothetical protein
MDQSFNDEVWNYPVYQYTSTSRSVSPREALAIIGSRRTTYEFNAQASVFMDVQTTISYADARDGQEFLGYTLPVNKAYRYILELDSGGRIIGGEWANESRLEHPDFVWIALEPKQGNGLRTSANPYLQVDQVLDMWAESLGYSSYADAPRPFEFNDQFYTWGKFNEYDITVDQDHSGGVFTGEKTVFNITLKGIAPGTTTQGLNLFLGQNFLASPVLSASGSSTVYADPVAGINRVILQWQLPILSRNDQIKFFAFP